MNRLELSSKTRTDFRKGETKRMRGAGRIPATVYGKGCESSSIEINAEEFSEILKVPGGRHMLIDLSVDGKVEKAHPVLIQKLQREAISKQVVHVDFHRVSMNEPVHASVSIVLDGEAPGVKFGGILEQITSELELKVLPDQIPTEFHVDISKLEMGQAIHVSDLAIPEGIEVLHPAADGIVATVKLPSVQAEAEAAPAEEAAAAEKTV